MIKNCDSANKQQIFPIQFTALIDIMAKVPEHFRGAVSNEIGDITQSSPRPSLFVKTSFVCPKADTDTKIT